MKKGLSSTKLTTKIALMNAVIVLLAVALGAFFSVRSLTSNITDLLHKDALSTASFVNAEIETILLPKTALVETLATTLAVQSFQYDHVIDPALTLMESNSDITRFYLVNAMDSTSLILSRTGDRVYVDTSADAFGAKEQDWLLDTIFEQRTIFTTPQKVLGSDSLAFTISTPVRNQSGQLAGVLAVDVSLADFHDIMQSITVGSNGYVMVLDSSGFVLYHPDESKLLDDATAYMGTHGEVAANMVQRKSGKGEIEIDGVEYLVYYSPINLTGWSVATCLPKRTKPSDAPSDYADRHNIRHHPCGFCGNHGSACKAFGAPPLYDGTTTKRDRLRKETSQEGLKRRTTTKWACSLRRLTTFWIPLPTSLARYSNLLRKFSGGQRNWL